MSDPSSGPVPGPAGTAPAGSERRWWLRYWEWVPLYLRILGGVILGVAAGLVLGRHAVVFDVPSQLILQFLGALAAPLILFAIIQALMQAEISGRQGARLVGLLTLNTLVAISIGLLVANVVRPGAGSDLRPEEVDGEQDAGSLLDQILRNMPRSVFGPLGDQGSMLAVVILALAFGIALRQMKRREPTAVVEDLVGSVFRMLLIVLNWVLALIPFAVFGIIASTVGVKGFGDFLKLGWFVVAVLIGLALQAVYYLLRIRFGSWVGVGHVLRGTREALVIAFSTASSTATMPVTYSCLRTRVGLRERSASLGALIGANFNNDGTALYEAMAALFVSQLMGKDLGIAGQLMVVLTSVIASVGAAGIPKAGMITMTVVFNAVGLPLSYIPLLFAVDWFLDRCRTAINVMGDVTVSCLLDGKEREAVESPPPEMAQLEA